MATIYLKLSGSDAERITALKSAHPDLVGKDEEGKDRLGNHFNHDIAIMYYPNLTLAPVAPDVAPLTDGPYYMIRFLGDQKLPPTLPLGLERKWEVGGAPVDFLGDI